MLYEKATLNDWFRVAFLLFRTRLRLDFFSHRKEAESYLVVQNVIDPILLITFYPNSIFVY